MAVGATEPLRRVSNARQLVRLAPYSKVIRVPDPSLTSKPLSLFIRLSSASPDVQTKVAGCRFKVECLESSTLSTSEPPIYTVYLQTLRQRLMILIVNAHHY